MPEQSQHMNDLFTGTCPLDQALVSQWLEYRVLQVDRCSREDDLHRVLKVSSFADERTLQFFLEEMKLLTVIENSEASKLCEQVNLPFKYTT